MSFNLELAKIANRLSIKGTCHNANQSQAYSIEYDECNLINILGFRLALKMHTSLKKEILQFCHVMGSWKYA